MPARVAVVRSAAFGYALSAMMGAGLVILIFLFGPVGWLLYFLFRSVPASSMGVNDAYAEESAGSTGLKA